MKYTNKKKHYIKWEEIKRKQQKNTRLFKTKNKA